MQHVPLLCSASVRKQLETSFFRLPQGRQPIRGADITDIIVIISSWRVQAHGDHLTCVALYYGVSWQQRKMPALRCVRCVALRNFLRSV